MVTHKATSGLQGVKHSIM